MSQFPGLAPSSYLQKPLSDIHQPKGSPNWAVKNNKKLQLCEAKKQVNPCCLAEIIKTDVHQTSHLERVLAGKRVMAFGTDSWLEAEDINATQIINKNVLFVLSAYMPYACFILRLMRLLLQSTDNCVSLRNHSILL